MDWSKGISASYRACIVDPVTWRDIDEIEIIGGSITKDDYDLRESANISVLNYDSTEEQWIRVYLDARQSSSSYYGALFTGLISSPSVSIDGNVRSNDLRCYSVLKPASDILLPKGWFANKGDNSGSLLTSLLGVMAPIQIEGNAPDLSHTIIAESGETNLSMADWILSSIGWRLYILGDGTIVISKKPTTYDITFDADNNDCLETKLTMEHNWFDCPNVFRAESEGVSATAKDMDVNSILSIPNRGREIWMEENGAALFSGESLQEYAERRLREEQMVSKSISYKRRFNPDINIGDYVLIHYPGQKVDGVFCVNSQTIDIGYGAAVSEGAVQVWI